jgi:transposase InsO family protein
MITQLASDYPIKLLCELLELPRSSYYYQPQATEDDPALITAVEQLLASKPFLGYRMVLAYLKRDGWQVGERPIRRILRALKGTRSAGRLITTDSSHAHPRFPNLIRGMAATHPNHIWVADITYLRYGRQYLYLAVVLDLYSRAVRGWQLEEFLTSQALSLPALHMALEKGTPDYFHSDQGRQYAARAHVELLKGQSVTISMSDAGQPTQNAVVERFIKTLKYEHVFYTEYESLSDMRSQLKHFLEIEYNRERPHSALGYLTPLEFEREYYWRNRFFFEP